MNVIAIAHAGMVQAANRLENSAHQTLAAFTPQGTEKDLVQGTIGQIEAKHEFAASARVAKVADEMMGVLLDIKA